VLINFERVITDEISVTLEDNFIINGFLEAIGAHRYKTLAHLQQINRLVHCWNSFGAEMASLKSR
jgi:hypothetical protein